MINKKSIKAVNSSKFETNLVKPLYDSYCFSNIPGTIKNIMCKNKNNSSLPFDCLPQLENINNVVLFLIDGYGWKFFEKGQSKFPFLKRFINRGVVSKLTAQFPSTTAAEITTMNTDLPVYKSGIYEWNYYEPQVDDIIQPFLYKKTRDENLNSLKIEPSKIFPNGNIYKKLKSFEIKSTVINFKDYTNTTYNKFITEGAENFGYTSLPVGLNFLTQKLIDSKDKNYLYFYTDNIDHSMHEFGSDSNEKKIQTELLFGLLEDFIKNIENKVENTLILVTADHGHINVNTEKMFYLNREFPRILKWIKKNKKDDLLAPAGSIRDLFLHIKEENLDQAKFFLSEKLKEVALVFKTQELIDSGFFGKNISENFLKRIGNLLILPKENRTIWWEGKEFEITVKSHHGGLSKDEMEIPLLSLVI